MIINNKIFFVKELGYYSRSKTSGNSYVVLIKTTVYYLFIIPIYTRREMVNTTASL
jgi:hypothetical protein